MAAVVAIVGWWVGGTGRPKTAALPHPLAKAPTTTLDPQLIHRTVVETDQGRLRIFHFDGTGETDLAAPIVASAPRPVSVGDAIIFVAKGQASAIGVPFNSEPNTMGPADRLIPGVNPGTVWLVRDQSAGPVTVQLACILGPGVQCRTPLTGQLNVPSGMRPVAAVLNSLLLVNSNPQTTAPPIVWDPIANRVVFHFSGTFGDVVDTHLNQVAWRGGGQRVFADGDQCPLHITDVGKGTDQVIPPPANSPGYLGGGAFSPDGAYLAAFVSAPFDSNPKARPVIIRLGAQPDAETVSATIDVGEPVGAAAWDPTSYTVFVSGLSGNILACRPDDPNPTPLPIPGSYSFAVL